jgi:hypothetical protein
MIRRDAVESMRGNLYRPELNKCLDHTMMDVMIAHKFYPEIVKYEGELAMDFKSEVNIHPWEKFQNMGKDVTSTI